MTPASSTYVQTRKPSRIGRPGIMAGAIAFLAIAIFASLAVGKGGVSVSMAMNAIFSPTNLSDAEAALMELRVPRTLLATLAGAALGVSGAIMQAVTRNPLSDPGILGINTGAALAIVLGTGFLGIDGSYGPAWLAISGAALTAILVHAIGFAGSREAAPVRLTLAGVAITAMLGGIVTAILLLDPVKFDRIRGWNTGALSGADVNVMLPIAPFIAAGLLLAALNTRSLNALALGEDVARAMGANVTSARLVGGLAATLLAAAATAGAGPIPFIGLMVPHLVRGVARADQRWTFAFALVLSPALLLTADILGRVLLRSGEIPAGIVMAVIGVPVFILLVGREKGVRS